MDLEEDMASLDIEDSNNEITNNANKKKRRLSGFFTVSPEIQKEMSESASSSSSSSGDSCETCDEDKDCVKSEEVGTKTLSTVVLRRSGRKRIHPLESEKRRVVTKPRKLSNNEAFDDIKNYYLDRRVRRLPPSLETIFEEPKQSQDEVTFMSSRKFRRIIDFNSNARNISAKLKKRKMKAKGVSAIKRVRDKKFTIDFLMGQLAGIEDD